jgi:erythromycin esterase
MADPRSRKRGVQWRLDLLAAALTILLTAIPVAAQPTRGESFPDLGFERRSVNFPESPPGWFSARPGYDVVLDSATTHSGRFSLRSRWVSAGPDGSGGASAVAPLPLIRGKRVRLSAWIRTEGVTRGSAGLRFMARGPGATAGTVLVVDSIAPGASGTSSWTRHSIELAVDARAELALFGPYHRGNGTAWYDDLEIEIDGVRYVPPVPPPAWRATAREIAWLRRHASPLRTVAPEAGLDDVHAIRPLARGARIVGLGEGTHGTREFSLLKHRLIRWLVEREGFSVIAIEDKLGDVRLLNEYVRTGRGDPRSLMSGLYGIWKTEEILALVYWMRAHNAAGRGRVELWGFDTQTPYLATDSVRAFVARADPELLPQFEREFIEAGEMWRSRGVVSDVTKLQMWRAAAERVLSHLTSNRERYLARMDTAQVEWAIEHARLVQQGVSQNLPGGLPRDSSMAMMVSWIARQRPGAKVVLWAHNSHVARRAGQMGEYLAREYGSAYRPLGFALGEGRYSAFTQSAGAGSFPAIPAPAGSVESALRATGLPIFGLDLRAARDASRGRWLLEPHDFRSIGSGPVDEQFTIARVAEEFDFIVYVDRTTPTRVFPGVALSPGR